MTRLRETIDREWLQGRFLVLELAALLDRLDVAAAKNESAARTDRRIELLHRALAELAAPSATPNRAERLLELYSELADVHYSAPLSRHRPHHGRL